MILRVAFPYKRPVSAYEPTKIHLAPEYIFLENTYSPLVELSADNGAPMAGIAESFKWVNNELHLKIRENLTTVSGYRITAEDAAFSLKRLLILSGNTHGNFKNLVCSNTTLKRTNEVCTGMEVKGNVLILRPDTETPFLLSMLAAIDFAVIPQIAVDPKDLSIKDYKNTSGPYYVFSDDGKGRIVLKANKNHYNYSIKMPQEIVLVPSGIDGEKDSITLFKENKVDFITTIDKLNPEKIINFSKIQESNLHTTMNIRTFILVFTQKGLKKLSKDKRLAVGKSIKNIFQDYYKNTAGYQTTNQFFPALGDGSLSDQEEKEIKSIYSNANNKPTGNDLLLSIVRVGNTSQFFSKIKNALSGINVEEGKNLPSFVHYKSEEEMPDCFINGPDTGFMEDIGLISYSINAGYFGMEQDERKKWLAKYMSINNKQSRMEILRRLHVDTLKNAILVPLVSAPYVALARKSWKIKLSQMYANNQLWLITK